MENELDKLSRMTPPKPSKAARARAMALAMQAFDAEEKNQDAPQGSKNGRRQSSITTQLWRAIMNGKLLAGSALATLLVVPVAGYVAIHSVNSRTGLVIDEPAKPGDKSENHVAKEKPKTGEIDLSAGKPEPKQPEVADKLTIDKPVVPEETKTEAQPVTPDDAKVDQEQNTSQSAQLSTTTTSGGLLPGANADRRAERPASQSKDSDFKANETADLMPKSDNRPAAAAQDNSSDVDEAARPADALAASPTVEGRVMAKKMLGATTNDGTIAQPQVLQPDSANRFTSKDVNPVKSVSTDPVSTFSIDVDTASYSFARQAILAGHLPEADSVRVEEMINYFPYDWAPPANADQAFKPNITVMPTPWNANTLLMHIGIKGYELQQQEQKPSNLVFLIDVSGSMDEPNKLPLLKSAFRLLVNKLKPTDTVSIVVYAGNSGVVLEPTKVAEKQKILEAIESLSPGGSTAGAEGIEAAYKMAEKAFIKDGVNRIFLATDGDFNVGPSSDDALKSLIESKRKTGIFLSVLGFGNDNYNDALMQTLAQNGNGVAAYIDTLAEAQKTLVQEATASIFPIAKDVKIQVEFNPEKIAEYRLIGYETRALKREDFNNDKVDAGEIGSGHEVTAIYELTPKGSPAMLVDDLRYGEKKDTATATDTSAAKSDELAFVKIRYKTPTTEDKSNLITMPVKAEEMKKSIDSASADVRFSVAVAAFGQKLKNEDQVSDYSWDSVLKLGDGGKGADPYGYRAEFLKLVELAKSLKGE
jgi:Ca-activated chloride channel family protein